MLVSRSRKTRSTSKGLESLETVNDAHRPRMLLFAGVWLVGFFVYFFSLDLPNNQGYPRSRVWLDLPDLLSSVSVSGPNNGWRYLPQRFDVWLVAGAILAGAWGIGHLALRFIGVGLPRRSSERTVFAFGLGLSALSLTTLGFGLLGWQSRVLFGALICAAVSFECFFRWRGLPKDGDRMTEFGTGNRDPNEDSVDALLKAGCLAAISPFVLAMLLGATLPSTDFDVNEYHLQGPKEFYQNGRVTFLPHNVYTSFPFLTEMLSLLAMVLVNNQIYPESYAQLMHVPWHGWTFNPKTTSMERSLRPLPPAILMPWR